MSNSSVLLLDAPAHHPSADPHALKGAFCIPTTPERVWWPAFLAVSQAEQDRYIAETLKRGYNHAEILVSGKPYADVYPYIQPDAGVLYAGLSKLKAAGLTTIVAFDDGRGPDLSYLRDVLAPSVGLIDWCMGIYEVNGVFKDPAIVLDVLTQCRQLLPKARLAVHFTPLDEGEESYGLVDFQRAKDEAGLNALFFQSAAWKFRAEIVAARLADFTRRLMAGFHGYPILSDGVYVFELTTTKTFRYEWSEAEAVRVADAVLHAPLEPDGGVFSVTPAGFCDGGSA